MLHKQRIFKAPWRSRRTWNRRVQCSSATTIIRSSSSDNHRICFFWPFHSHHFVSCAEESDSPSLLGFRHRIYVYSSSPHPSSSTTLDPCFPGSLPLLLLHNNPLPRCESYERRKKERKKDSNNKAPSRSSSSKPKINFRKRTRTTRRAMIAQESRGALELTKENGKSSECFLGQATTDHSCKRWKCAKEDRKWAVGSAPRERPPQDLEARQEAWSTGAPAQAHNHIFSLSLSLSQREFCADDCEFHEFLGRFLSIFYFKKPKTHHKKKDCSHGFVLFFQFCEVSKWVGDSDFLLAKFRNLATGKRKKTGVGLP